MIGTIEEIKERLYRSADAPSSVERTYAPSSGLVVSSGGELGDILYLAAVLKDHPGGPHTLILHLDREGLTSGGAVRHSEIIRELLESQPYIAEVRVVPGVQGPETWHSEDFRRTGHHGPMVTLVQAHCRHGMSVGAIKKLVAGAEKWLTVESSTESAGRVVIAKTERWQNPLFPWKEVVKTYGTDLMFLGTPREHQLFKEANGAVSYRPTRDLMEAARLIAGSWLYISNQTSLWAIAEGLKVRRIQETHRGQTDCIYRGGDVQWCLDGGVKLPTKHGDFVEILSPLPEWSPNIGRSQVPPGGGWKLPGVGIHQHFKILSDMAMANGMGREEADHAILAATVKAHPDFFPRGERQDYADHLKFALEASGT